MKSWTGEIEIIPAHSKILITGGTGFIGRRLSESLLSKSMLVTCFSRSKPDQSDLGDYVKGDITDPVGVADVVRNKDVIFHLAGNSDLRLSIESMRYDAETNVIGTLNVLDAARMYNREATILLMSSAAVYGESRSVVVKESEPTRPVNPYGASKAACEIYADLFARKYGLKIVTLRLFHAYGEITRNEIIPNTIQKVLAGEPPIIHGQGSQFRDFIHIDDVITIMELAVSNPKAYGKIINCGTGIGTKIVDLVQLIIELFGDGRRLEPIFQGSDVSGRGNISDTTLMRELLHKVPEIDLRRGLRKMINKVPVFLSQENRV